MKSFRVLVAGQEKLIREAHQLLLKLGYSNDDPLSLDSFVMYKAFYLNAGHPCESNDRIGWDREAVSITLPIITIEELREMVKQKEEGENMKESLKETSLLTSQQAKLAWANGEDVQISHKHPTLKKEWHDLYGTLMLSAFDSDMYEFRIKPRTIKIELEIPAPFEPKDGERFYYLDARCSKGYMLVEKINSNCVADQFGAWRTEEEIKQVVAALKSVFNCDKE